MPDATPPQVQTRQALTGIAGGRDTRVETIYSFTTERNGSPRFEIDVDNETGCIMRARIDSAYPMYDFSRDHGSSAYWRITSPTGSDFSGWLPMREGETASALEMFPVAIRTAVGSDAFFRFSSEVGGAEQSIDCPQELLDRKPAPGELGRANDSSGSTFMIH